jgi:hypothetical protein
MFVITTPMFSWSSNPKELQTILFNHTGSEKFKMAAAKPKILTSHVI